MPRRCTICLHPDREKIDLAIVQGVPVRTIAEQYNCGPAAVQRHKVHVKKEIIDSKKTKRTKEALTYREKFDTLVARAYAELENAKDIDAKVRWHAIIMRYFSLAYKLGMAEAEREQRRDKDLDPEIIELIEETVRDADIVTDGINGITIVDASGSTGKPDSLAEDTPGV